MKMHCKYVANIQSLQFQQLAQIFQDEVLIYGKCRIENFSRWNLIHI